MKIHPTKKTCTYCGGEFPIIGFYFNSNRNGYQSICKNCHKEKMRLKFHLNYEMIKIPSQPGKYINQEQKEQTFEVMRLMGWQYHEQNQKWFKYPLKDELGVWGFQKKIIALDQN
jgi:hypothetical protein